MQTRNATGNLVNRYKAVLKKCNLINVFGTLAVASMLVSPIFVGNAYAVGINPTGSTISTMDSGGGERQKDFIGGSFQDINHVYNDSVLINNGTISGGAGYRWEDGLDASDFVLNSNPKSPNPLIGMYGYSENVGVDFSFTNNGSILMQKNTADKRQPIRGVHISSKGANIFTNNAGALINIDIKTSESASVSDYSIYRVVGIFSKTVPVSGIPNNEVNNNGNILINLQTENNRTTGNLRNYIADVYGIYTDGGHAKTTNSTGAEIKIIAKTGDITQGAEGAEAYIRDVYGIFADVRGDSNVADIENKGFITIDAESGDVKGQKNKTVRTNIELYGIHVGKIYGSDDVDFAISRSTINNSGTININGKAGTAEVVSATAGDEDLAGSDASNSTADVTGIYVFTRRDNVYFSTYARINNSGTINVEAITSNGVKSANATAHGIWSISDGHYTLNLNNSGIINVTATATGIASQFKDNNSNLVGGTADATAYGMLVKGEGDNIFLSNTGIINLSASAQQAGATAKMYEAYAVDLEYNATTKLQIGTWATTLRDWTLTDTVFGGDVQTSVNLTNSTLMFRPEQGVALGKTYSLENLVVINEQKADVQLGNITAEVPFLNAVVTGGTTTGATSVSLNLNSAGMPNNTAIAQSSAVVQGQMASISTELSNAIVTAYLDSTNAPILTASLGDTAVSTNNMLDKWSYFGNLYASYTGNGRYNADSKGFGLTTGANKKIDEQLTAGFHVDMNVTSSDSGAMDNYLKSLAFGGHANYFVDTNIYVGASATYALGTNDSKYKVGSETAQDHYRSHALFMAGNLGYIYEMDENNIMMPEVGLSYLYSYANDYSFNFANTPVYNMNIHSNAYSALYADFKLKWQGNIQLESGSLTPTALFGFRQTLAGADIDSTLDMFGNRFESTANSDSTSVLTGVGLSYTNDNLTLGAKYDVAFGGNQHSHKGSLDLVYRF